MVRGRTARYTRKIDMLLYYSRIFTPLALVISVFQNAIIGMTKPSLALLNCSFSVVYLSWASPDNGVDLFD